MKNIVICSDGTWNRPEENTEEDFPTNVLKFARGIAPKDDTGKSQVVFYDWGIGSYHNKVSGGAFGSGLEKNIMDGYRFLVHNYEPGDKIFLFGFSRGAYTVRSLSGLINNCSILKGSESNRIQEAFDLYKNPKYKPNGEYSLKWKKDYSVSEKTNIHFIGVWDTVGAMGLPFSFFGLIKDKHRFYDNKLGSNIVYARHAMSLDEQREDFKPTIWKPRKEVDLKQVWFAGVHCDVGGSYKNDSDGTSAADIPMIWLKNEAYSKGLAFEEFLFVDKLNPHANLHNEYKGFYRFKKNHIRRIPSLNSIPTLVHSSVKERYKDPDYTSEPIERYKKKYKKWPPIEE